MFILIRYTKGFCISTAHRPAMRINITYILIASMCDGPLPPLSLRQYHGALSHAAGGAISPCVKRFRLSDDCTGRRAQCNLPTLSRFPLLCSPFQFVISYNSHGSREIELSFPLYYYYRSHILHIYMLRTVFWITTRIV